MGVQSPGPTPAIGLLLQPAVSNSASMWPPSLSLIFEAASSSAPIPAYAAGNILATSVIVVGMRKRKNATAFDHLRLLEDL